MSGQKPWGSLSGGLKWAIAAALALCVVMVLYVTLQAAFKPAADGGIAALAHGQMAKLKAVDTAYAAPDTPFVGADGKAVRLTDFKGKVVVLNLWATWCAPCVKEMPTLAALQTAYAGRPVQVVALSTDSPTQTDKARAFIAAHAPLAFYQDVKQEMPSVLKPQVIGFPTTMIYDRAGRLQAVMAGDADWSSPEARAVVDRVLTAG